LFALVTDIPSINQATQIFVAGADAPHVSRDREALIKTAENSVAIHGWEIARQTESSSGATKE